MIRRKDEHKTAISEKPFDVTTPTPLESRIYRLTDKGDDIAKIVKVQDRNCNIAVAKTRLIYILAYCKKKKKGK